MFTLFTGIKDAFKVVLKGLTIKLRWPGKKNAFRISPRNAHNIIIKQC